MAILTEAQKKVQAKFIPYWVGLLKNNKVPDDVIPLLLSQIIFESNWFTSNAYKLDNNPGGITWNENYRKRPGASIGIERPKKEKEGKTNNYVHFDTFDSAAKDYVRIIKINAGAGRPIDSTNYVDYARRLKVNKYYRSNESDYAAGLKAQIKRIYNYIDIESLIKKKAKTNLLLGGLVPILIVIILFRKKIFK
jgi:flagellum-specific peptidoglycan hydrolase FlgJ